MRGKALACVALTAVAAVLAQPSRADPRAPSPVPTFVTAQASDGNARPHFGVSLAASTRGAHTWGGPPDQVCLDAFGTTTWHGSFATFTETTTTPSGQPCAAPLKGARYGFDPVTWDADLVASLPTLVTLEQTRRTRSGRYVKTTGVLSGRAQVSLTFRDADIPCRVPVGLIFFVVPIPDPTLHTGRCAAVTGWVQLAGRREPLRFAPEPVLDTSALVPLATDRAVVGIAAAG